MSGDATACEDAEVVMYKGTVSGDFEIIFLF
jgi:hypothetical protein